MTFELLGTTYNQFSGDSPVVDHLAIKFDAELVPRSILPRRNVLPQIGKPGGKSLRVLMGTAEICADAVLFLSMGGAESGESNQFGVHLRLFNHERVAGGDGFDFGIGKRCRIEVFKAANGHVAA